MYNIEDHILNLIESDDNCKELLKCIIELSDGFRGDATDFSLFLKDYFLTK